MKNLKFITKPVSVYINNGTFDGISFDKPQTCPHCNINTDAKHIFSRPFVYDNNAKITLLLFAWSCTVCNKLFLSFTLVQNKQSAFCGIFPQQNIFYTDETIEKISPRFIEMYNQALLAESIGSFNLAAVGLRSALEILIKDFAIVCLNESREKVSKLDLFKAISEYLGSEEMINTADVVRILGNDHTHYERKYPEYNYSEIKEYMGIFIRLIRMQIRAKYPPLSRKS